MIQLVVDGIFLDLYENDPPKLTYSIEDVTDTKITSTYSKNFRVPATKTNTEFFKTAFEINGFDFDVTVTINANILLDGQLLRQGQIRLQKIYLTNGGNAAEYEILFLGETKTLASEIGDALVNQLDYSEFDTTLSWTTISSSWYAYSGTGTTNYNNGLFSGSILFPLVDFGNIYSGSSNDVVDGSTIDYSTDPASDSFLNSADGLPINRFKPMIRAKVIWDKIFSGSSYTYESNFIDSNIFRHLYISAWGNEATNVVETTGSANTFNASGDSPQYNYVFNYPESQTVQRLFFDEVLDPANNYNTVLGSYEYVAPANGSYRFQLKIKHKIKLREDVISALEFTLGNYDTQFTFRLRKNTGGVITTLGTVTYAEDATDINGNDLYSKNSSERSISATIILTGTVTLSTGDEIYPEITWVLANNTDVSYMEVDMNASYFKCLDAPGDFSVAPYINNKYKQIDFIKDIATKFRLVLAPDKNNPNNIIVEPWQSYIGTGDIFDWSPKLDLSKDVVVEPLFNTQKKKIFFKDKEDGDYYNQLNKTQYNEIFGTLEVDSANDLLTEERTVTTTLSPTVVNQLKGWPQFSGDLTLFIIPHIYTVEAAPGALLYKPIVPNTRLLFYNGLVDPGQIGIDSTPSWYVLDEAGVTRTVTDEYPKVSPYSTKTITDSTLDLNWQRETGYFYDGTNDDGADTGNSVYDLYWEDYISSLYDKWSRKVTAYFILDAADLQDFSFDDVIFVKGIYYYVEKIYDVPLDKKESVKVDLVKLNNFRVPTSGFVPPTPPTEFNLWGDWPVIWEVTTDIWDD
jgi:hypothetical protein